MKNFKMKYSYHLNRRRNYEVGCWYMGVNYVRGQRNRGEWFLVINRSVNEISIVEPDGTDGICMTKVKTYRVERDADGYERFCDGNFKSISSYPVTDDLSKYPIRY